MTQDCVPPTPADDGELERWLGSTPHVEDDGFTLRVVDALPPARRRLRFRVVGGAALLGCTIAGVFVAPHLTLHNLVNLFDLSRMELGALILFGCAAVTAIWAANEA